MESSTKGGSGSSTSQLTPAFPTSGMTSFSQSLQSQSQSHPMRDSMGNTPDIIDYNVAVVADDLTNIHDALVSEKKIVSEKTMEDLRQRVQKHSEAEVLRVESLEADVLGLAEQIIELRERREQISAERSRAIQELDKKLSSVLQFERMLLNESESMIASTITGMQTSISKSLLNDAQGRQLDWNGSWPPAESLGEIVGSESMLAALKDRASEGTKQVYGEAANMQKKSSAAMGDLVCQIESEIECRDSSYKQLQTTIQRGFQNIEEIMKQDHRQRLASEESLSAFLDRTINKFDN